MSLPRIAVIGAGNMGHRHARVVAESTRSELVAVVDVDQERAQSVARAYGAEAAVSVDEVDADAVVLAVPTEHHFDLGLNLINRRVPLLVEKPIAPTFPEAQLMIEAARAMDVPLMCGFVERFNPVVTTIRDLLDGPIIHLVATRHSPPADQIRSSVVSDLLIHDIDIALQLMSDQLGAEVLPAVSGSVSPGPRQHTWGEIADCTLAFSDGSMASFSASRMSQRKIRTMSVCTERSLFEVDLLRQDITVYRHVSQRDPGPGPGYRSETVVEIPFIRASGEPLANQLDRFIDMIEGAVDLDAERASMTVAHQVTHAVETLVAGVGSERLGTAAVGGGSVLTDIDDIVSGIDDDGTIVLRGLGRVQVVASHADQSTFVEQVEAGAAVRFEIDLELSGSGPILAGRLFRKSDGLPLVPPQIRAA